MTILSVLCCDLTACTPLFTVIDPIRSESQACKELRDRLYRSKESHVCLAAMGGTPPEFPYSNEPIVQLIPSRSSAHQQAEAQQQHQAVTQNAQSQHLTSSVSAQAAVQQSQQPSAVAQPASAAAQQQQEQPQLAPGWAPLQDPTSGQTYYANSTTGESSWEIPLAPAAAPQQQYQAPANGGSMAEATTPSKLASKYGDGFVTSASHPELAERYGNTGTSSAYRGASRPGTAAVSATQSAPLSGNFDPNTPPEVPPEHKPTVDGLIALMGILSDLPLSSTEKKQIAEIHKGVGVFTKKLSRGLIDNSIAGKMATLVAAASNRDYRTAGAVQTALVNSDWREHKDWLKGMKFLIQLAGKKLY